MAAKITGVDVAPSPIGGGLPRSNGQTGARAADRSVQSSEVSITGAATRLAALEQSLEQLPSVDGSRVSAFQAAIASGQYQTDPQSIASRLASTERALYELQGAGG